MSVVREVESLLPGDRAYVCPLDNSANLPELTFGSNRIARFSTAELEALFDLSQPPRINPRWGSELDILSQYHWLVVDTQMFEPELWQVLLSSPADSDFAKIEPHRLPLPAPVVDALFAILLAPWEDWVENRPGFWRPFRIPWTRRVGGDPSVRRQPPVSAAALSWDVSPEGQFRMVAPVELKDRAADDISACLNHSRWEDLAAAQQSPLFETPVKHFFVKAFLEDEADEFLAHITTIEAALLYNRRCEFVHGRKMDAPISGRDRDSARRLARQVVNQLVEAALQQPRPQSREAFLKSLDP